MKNSWKVRNIALLVAVISLFAIACADDNAAGVTLPEPSLGEIIASSSELSSFNTALERTNLKGSLTTGTLTVFAPDNAAFTTAGIDVNTAPVTKLDSIIKYSVLGQTIEAAAIPASDTLKSLLGRNIYASRNANGTFVNGFNIKQPDVRGSNGLAHIITNVLIPPTQTIGQIAAADTSFSFLVAALTKLSLIDTVGKGGKYTVFAPTNAAFRAAGITDINIVPVPTLDAIVKYHILPTNVFSSDFVNNATATTMQGGTITFTTTPSAGVKITGSIQPLSGFSANNRVATNGVIHVINRIMLP